MVERGVAVREPPPLLGGQVRWRRLNRHWEVIPNSTLFPRQVATATSCPFATFSEEVTSGASEVSVPDDTVRLTTRSRTSWQETPRREPCDSRTVESFQQSVPALAVSQACVGGGRSARQTCQTLRLESGCSYSRADTPPQCRHMPGRLLVLLVLCQAGSVDAQVAQVE